MCIFAKICEEIMRQRTLVLFFVFILTGTILSAQEKRHVSHDVTTRLQPEPSIDSTILSEIKDNNIHGDVVKIIETQEYHKNPKYDYTGYYLIERDKKYSKDILYTTTPIITTTFSYNSNGKIIGFNQDIVETTFYKRIKTKVLLSTNDQQSVNKRRRHIKSSVIKPIHNFSRIIHKHFVINNELSDFEIQEEKESDYSCQHDAQGRLVCIEGEFLGSYNPYPNRCCSIMIPIRKVTFKYDEHGNLCEKYYYTGDGITIVYSLVWRYEYDDVGNWVKCLHYEDGFLIKKSERKIFYP